MTDLLRECDVEDMLFYARGTLRTLRCRGSKNVPPFVRLGRAIRYRKPDVVDWVASRVVRPS